MYFYHLLKLFTGIHPWILKEMTFYMYRKYHQLQSRIALVASLRDFDSYHSQWIQSLMWNVPEDFFWTKLCSCFPQSLTVYHTAETQVHCWVFFSHGTHSSVSIQLINTLHWKQKVSLHFRKIHFISHLPLEVTCEVLKRKTNKKITRRAFE